jgi:signal transduction histidine kinase
MLAFCCEFTSVLNKRRIFPIVSLALGTVVAIFLMTRRMKETILVFFGYAMNYLIVPQLLVGMAILVYALVKNRNRYVLPLLVAFVFGIALAANDVFYLNKSILPYAWLTAYGYLAVVIAIFATLAKEQGDIYQKALLSLSLAERLNIAQRENEEAQRRIAELEKLKTLGLLAAGVAHEINTPNNAVLRNLPILSEVWQELEPTLRKLIVENGNFRLRGWSAEELMIELPELLADTFAAGQQISKIVEDLKDYARDRGRRPPEDVDLSAVVNYAVRLLAPLVGEKTKSLTVEAPSGIPPVRANFQKLTQVTINILENALQSLPNDQASVKLRVHEDSGREAVIIECQDEGMGIDPLIKANIFEPFFTTKRDIVRESGGNIEIDSEPGRGTTVRVVLPVAHGA